MTVSELIKLLSKEDGNSEVILQKDGEGNDYSPLYGVDGEAVYIPSSTYIGKVYSTSWNNEDACMSKEEWKEVMRKKRCVVLYPVN